MKVLSWKLPVMAVMAVLAGLASGAIAQQAAPSDDDVTRRTEKALFKMSQIEAGDKRVRVLTPTNLVAAEAPLVDPPSDYDVDYSSNEPATIQPVPDRAMSGQKQVDTDHHNPSLLNECCEEGCETCCPDLCCDCLCGHPGKYWVRADILGWWTKGMDIPPLVTAGVDQNQPGVIGEPGTEILYGNESILDRARVGGRITAGMWLDDCQTWGIQADYFALQDLNGTYYTNGFDYPFLSRPIVDVTGGLPGDNGVEGVNNEDLHGEIRIDSKTGFQGGGLSLRRNLCCQTSCCDPGGSNPCNWNDWSQYCCRLDVIGGYRFYRLDDSILIRERLMSIADSGPVAFGTLYDIYDSFRTRNEFQGGDIGLVGTVFRGKWSLETTVKVGIGNNHSVTTIDGATTTTVPGQQPNTLEGGLLALDSNIGTYRHDDFVVIPQVGFQLGYQWTCHLRTFVGYDFMYWANVMRAGDQIDLRVDTAQLPPGSPGDYPEFLNRDTAFWAQGISGGVEVRW